MTRTRGDRAHHAIEARAWQRAFDLLSDPDGQPLDAAEWADLAEAAWWLGRVDDCLEAGEAAHRAHLDAGDHGRAAMAALELAMSLFLRGDDGLASGWVERAHRLVADLAPCPEQAYLAYMVEVEGGLGGADLERVAGAARAVRVAGEEHHDPNLVAAGLVGEARALLKVGHVDRGLRLLDEAMVAVVGPGLDPGWAGNVYCHLMAACHELQDVRRAAEWTATTSAWLSSVSPAVLFTGICRVHRSEVLQVTGEWARAEREAEQVLVDLADLQVESLAEAHYQLGDLGRLRGELADAEASYRRARQLGRDPQPGAALLALARGAADDARAALRAALAAAGDRSLERARLLPALVEAALACDDLDAAAEACTDLEQIAGAFGTSGLEAAGLHCRGALDLAGGRPGEALAALRASCLRWHEVDARHEVARARMLLGRAYRALGDDAAANEELSGARQTFDRLGAIPDRDAVDRLVGTADHPGGLSDREVEVLALVATGMTNREVAERLVLSERTIDRHVSNILRKLDVRTRTEAAAFAFTHGIASRGDG